ncbi:aminotransferase class V-fold PLP-dependent enzyme [Aquirufa sp.]|jgi:phosphoserine aminotransferase|uniref:aminotransferase class V-fold PLP-dependent enzyme n=1 Tax=Aquirufa sp. TaxID=2676249 RepID=UPI0037C04D93
MLSFYPGPSKVYPQALDFIQEAFDQGIVSINHRSKRFEILLKETMEAMTASWEIPADYTIYFVSSATEAWEIVAQSLVGSKSAHFYNGAFGKKWGQYASQINPNTQLISFGLHESLAENAGKLASDVDTVCLVQSETSNGTGQQICRADYPTDVLIAVDATSSMGGIVLPWEEADVWFASVQKCLGIPAGLGIMICSPKALQRAHSLNHRIHYNDILLMEDNRKSFQTHYTPNVLSIYLMCRLTQTLPSLREIEQETYRKVALWENFWNTQPAWDLRFLVPEKALRLPTVLALTGPATEIDRIQSTCLQHGIELGKGYGEWKSNTVRIANFPSHTEADIRQLINILTL